MLNFKLFNPMHHHPSNILKAFYYSEKCFEKDKIKIDWYYGKYGKNGRYFSTGKGKVFDVTSSPLEITKHNTTHSSFVSNLLKSLADPNNVLINNEQSQRSIENIVFDDYEEAFSRNTTRFIAGGINTEVLGPLLSKFIFEKKDIVNTYIDNLSKAQDDILNNHNNTDKSELTLMAKIITSLSKDTIFSLCITHFILVYSYQETEEDKQFATLPTSIKIGKKMFSKYINNLKDEYLNNGNTYITYTNWLNNLKQNNKEIDYYYDNDTFYSKMGSKIIDILTHTDLLDQKLLTTRDINYRFNALYVKDKGLMSNKNRQSVINLPVKLPMICTSKPYSNNVLGGYLLNDDKFSEQLLVEKKAYATTSVLTGDKIYSMVNKISATPFKINESLLDYLINEGTKHNLLIDLEVKHKFEDLPKRTKYQRSVYASHKSKIILQQTILDLAEFFRKFSSIYFPLRLDQRGRLYCTPSYLNYQSNELSKALLLFSEPGIITKKDV